MASLFYFLYNPLQSQPYSEIAQNVHVVDKCLVGRAVRIEILVNIAIGEPLGTHVVEVVARLKVEPVAP